MKERGLSGGEKLGLWVAPAVLAVLAKVSNLYGADCCLGFLPLFQVGWGIILAGFPKKD